EFMLLLTNTGIDGARSLAERIRSAGEKKTYDDGTNSTTATVSIGVASAKQHKPSDGKELVAFADKALYRAKESGKNTVVVFEELDRKPQ
ncbi:MAG: diguanylate cyclase, partial [Planctomycetes bacterium]|nr:diguanylate cyclase [Planctomycetota bacterium]